MTVAVRRLGRTGLAVSEIGHGMWGMGSWAGSDDERSLDSLRTAAAAGCTFFDSARAYGEGRSDLLLGRLLASAEGQELLAASKVPPANGRFPAVPSDRYDDVFPRRHVLASAELIRETIGVETIPLLQLHVWHDAWAQDAAFAAIVEELKAKRIVDRFGISLNRWEPENGIRAVESGLIDTVQVIYNVFDQAPEDELFPACREHDVGVIARVPLDEGSLGGTLTEQTRFPVGDWRARYFGPENLPETVDRVERIKALLPPDVTLPELALRFVLSNATVSTVVVGMRDPEHVASNLACSAKDPLPPALLEQLRAHRWDRVVAPWAN
jgi:aryl-alcohol dehydrogenase-like predicted oxidoreductase